MALCTVFCFAALFLPIDAEGSPSEGIFSAQIDKESLAERTNIAATMFLASSALLYVVASTLPKTSCAPRRCGLRHAPALAASLRRASRGLCSRSYEPSRMSCRAS